MLACMSKKSCDEVLLMMTKICKNIDEGRFIMKANCPIVTDVRLKEKATKVLMCYHPSWLQIGLNIVLGGDSLFLNEGQSDQEELFLKLIVEKQFFSHADLSKSYAYNKLVEGLYRPGYFEALGSIILKRFLLLVISLDKAKCESSLPLKYGIDGLDGGSPLLFCRQSAIRSSRQIINEFLSEVMHGEGDLLAHLVIVGCKLNYQQSALAEYNFSVTNLFDDLQDGMLMCRAIQLLQSDPSILLKMISPSDTHKKNLQNCSIAFQYLKKIGVPLIDGDGVRIVAEDLANGDKELTLSILWNMFLHMQVPLLINKASLVEEIKRIKMSNVDVSKYDTMTHMDLLLVWIQVACERYHILVDSFASLINMKVFHYLISYYIGTEETHCQYTDNLFGCEEYPFVDDQSPVLVQSMIAILGNFPELFPASDKLDESAPYEERSLIMLLVFLAPRLIDRENLDQLAFRFRRLNYLSLDVKSSAVCQSLSENSVSSHKFKGRRFMSRLKREGSHNRTEDRACTVLQSRFRGFTARVKYLKIKQAISFLQAVTRAWLAASLVRRSSNFNVCSVGKSSCGIYNRYFSYMIDRYKFIKVKTSVLLLQRLVRTWATLLHHKDDCFSAIILQSYVCGHVGRCAYTFLAQSETQQASFADQDVLDYQSRAATRTRLAWRCCIMPDFVLYRSSAVKIQKHWRGWYSRKIFSSEVRAIIVIQAGIRCVIYQRALMRCRSAAVEIQRIIRGHNARNWLLGCSNRRTGIRLMASSGMINSSRSEISQLRIVVHSILRLQRWWRQVLLDKSRLMSIILLQSSVRGFIARIVANRKKNSILLIQRWWRRLLFIKLRIRSVLIIQTHFRSWIARREARRDQQFIVTIQRLWRKLLYIKLRARSVVIIQAHFRGWIARRAVRQNKHLVILIQAHVRGWIARREARRDKHRIVTIQSYWKGWLVRKGFNSQELVLCHQQEKPSVNVEDDKQMMNKLVTMLSELHGCRSVSNIRYTCGKLNSATQKSPKCCEILVAAGAVDVLVKQLHIINRGVPDQEVLKHVLCTLQTFSRLPHLVHVFVDTSQCVATIFQELLRNKGEGYFVACDILKNLCATEEGLKAVNRLQGHVRRLNILAQDLERKAQLHKRNTRLVPTRDVITRRNEAVNLLILIASGRGR